MMIKSMIMVVFTLGVLVFQLSYAEPSVQVLLEKTTYSYGEKLNFTIQVSEITGDTAIVHIRDESGKGSSAIPFEISQLKTEVPSMIPFEKSIFPEGKYFIDVEYSGTKTTAEFDLVDAGNIVIPFQTKQMAYNWVTNQLSDGLLIDGIQKSVEQDIINIPFKVDKDNIGTIHIPDWVKGLTSWWLEEKITDESFANAFQYLLDQKIITN